MSQGPLLIVGASGRAAAASAIRAGYSPFVIDLFADEDAKRLCPVLKCPYDQYPHGFVELAEQAPPGPWMYTGGLENDPDIVQRISNTRELKGNGPEVLIAVRDPLRLQDDCRSLAIAFPKTQLSQPENSTQRWLRKSRRSSGGLGVNEYRFNDVIAPNEFVQEFVFGESMSAIYYDDRLLGTTKQLIGESWMHAKTFGYCGNISRLASVLTADLQMIGKRLVQQYCLRDVWGIDFINRANVPTLIEINPRMTAALEVIQYAKQNHCIVGKAIYYAARTFAFPESGPWDDSLVLCTDVWRRPDFADIPSSGTIIEAGQPMLTIFAEAECEDGVIQIMKSQAAALDRLFDFL